MAFQSKFDLDGGKGPGSAVDRIECKRRPLRTALLMSLGGLLVLGGCASERAYRDPLSQRYTSADVVGHARRHKIRNEETLLDLTRKYDLGYVELVAANPGVDPWLPGTGRQIFVPTAHLLPAGPRRGIVVNLAEQRLYLFEEESGMLLFSFPIGVSREGWTTPLGETKIVRKKERPVWYPTKSARREDPTLPSVVRAGPENPLGTHALYMGWDRYLIHGTNEPDGVGRRVSRGCIRLYPEDIVRLYEATSVGATVRVVHEPVKLAWVDGEVFLEVHPTLDEMARLEEEGALEIIRPADLRPQIREFAGPAGERIDWSLAYRIAAERRGIPIRISY